MMCDKRPHRVDDGEMEDRCERFTTKIDPFHPERCFLRRPNNRDIAETLWF